MKKRSEVLRVELEMRSRFLKHYKIRDPYDFTKLVEVLPERHIQFAKFNRKKLVERLRGMRFSSKRILEILEDVALLEGDVWATLNYLRQELALENARRLLHPLQVNEIVLAALKEWAAMWPAAPAKLNPRSSQAVTSGRSDATSKRKPPRPSRQVGEGLSPVESTEDHDD